MASIGLALLPLAGCGYAGARHGRPSVVASFYPLRFVAQRVVGDHARVVSLTQPGVEPHELSLTVRQTAELSAADVALYEKGLQPAVDQAIENNHPRRVVNAASVVTLHAPAAGYREETADNRDPHFWLNPLLLAHVARAFTRSMVSADPAHAAAYRANDARLQRQLTTLDRDIRAGTRHCRIRALVVSHDAFEYFGRRYHFDIVPLAGLTPDAEPSVRHLAQITTLAREKHVTTVFAERLDSPKMADSLAHDLGIGSAVLDPAEGLVPSDEGQNYLTLMRQNLRAIERANSCT